MGDAADLDFDQNFDAWLAHLRAECVDPCPYCQEQEKPNPKEEEQS